jgi:aldoxime dehydratase
MTPSQVRSRPETFEPPYPAFTTQFPDDWPDYVMCQIGVQAAPRGDPSQLMHDVEAILAEGHAPLHYERCRDTDAAGYLNEIYLIYWRSPVDFAAWLANPAVEAVLTRQLSGTVGLWLESIIAPVGNLDPNGMLPRHEWGIGRHLTQAWERYHSYYGSMRDRMANGRVAAIGGTDPPLFRRKADSFGHRLTVRPAHNLCFIRSIIGWENAKPHEQEAFITEVLPHYRAGVAYLRDQPELASCISARAVETVPMTHANGLQAETLAWFTSLAALEAWTHHHPTHAAIHGSVFKFAQTYGFDIQLNLGHEVVVVPEHGFRAVYNNCHPDTGFLPFFESEEIR